MLDVATVLENVAGKKKLISRRLQASEANSSLERDERLLVRLLDGNRRLGRSRLRVRLRVGDKPKNDAAKEVGETVIYEGRAVSDARTIFECDETCRPKTRRHDPSSWDP